MNRWKLNLMFLGVISGLGHWVANGDELDKREMNAGMVSIDLKEEVDDVQWRSVNDGVMGGRSKGDSYLTEAGNRMFKGVISLENNGGFSSVRTFGGKYDLSDYDGVEVRVRGDGRMYYFTARADNMRMRAYWFPIQTKAGEWMTARVPFSSMYATSFGKKIKGVKLNIKNVTSFGLMLYDKNNGDFSIELESMKVYK